jgi:hypothetical protein
MVILSDLKYTEVTNVTLSIHDRVTIKPIDQRNTLREKGFSLT